MAKNTKSDGTLANNRMDLFLCFSNWSDDDDFDCPLGWRPGCNGCSCVQWPNPANQGGLMRKAKKRRDKAQGEWQRLVCTHGKEHGLYSQWHILPSKCILTRWDSLLYVAIRRLAVVPASCVCLENERSAHLQFCTHFVETLVTETRSLSLSSPI